MKVCLLGVSFETGNMGVNVLTDGTIRSILKYDRDCEIFLLDYGRVSKTYLFQYEDKTVSIDRVTMRFSKHIYLPNNISTLLGLALLYRIFPASLRQAIIQTNQTLRRLADADVVVSVAGGDSFSDIYGFGRFLYVSLPQVLALMISKPLVLFPQTLGPFSSSLARLLTKQIIRQSHVTYSRDLVGVKEWSEQLTEFKEDQRCYKNSRNTEDLNSVADNNPIHGRLAKSASQSGLAPTFASFSQKVHFCYDVGFVVEPRRPKVMDLGGLTESKANHELLVGLNISGLLYIGGYTRRNMFGLKVDYQDLVLRLIDFLTLEKDAKILLVPHLFGGSDLLESDSIACEKIQAQLGGKQGANVFLVRGTYDHTEIKYIIGLCGFFIGSRMHACIGALSQCIPAVGIAYSRKFLGVMESIGVESLVADPRSLNSDEIIRIVDNALAGRHTIRKHLEEEIPRVKKRVLNLFGEAVGVIASGQQVF